LCSAKEIHYYLPAIDLGDASMRQSLKEIIEEFTMKLGIEITRVDRRFVSLKPVGECRGNVLLSYIIDPFLLKSGESMPHHHTFYWESWQMGRTFLTLGYSVDVISWANKTFIPQKDYALFIDLRRNLERIGPQLNKDCIKIMHIDIAHTLFNSYAELRRLLALQQRRGITLQPRRLERPNLAIEHADCATVLGNEFTISTFKYANKPLYPVPLASAVTYPWSEGKDFKACRKHFLWFGSFGLVHKGLDLVLEAFAELPEYQLTVCGPISKEEDFVKVYYKELYETPNIHTIGWVDNQSSEFEAIRKNCVGIIYASCGEGQSGSVVTCLHAGLIPIISYECGVNVHDFGVILKDCSSEEIKRSVQMVSNLSAEELERMARNAWEYARANHTREKFVKAYQEVIEKITNNFSAKGRK
jgi:glycosyltransferase involved in cell wall biosynthesis